MPRVIDISKTGQSHGGSLTVKEGNYRVMDAWYGNYRIKDFAPTCGLFLELLTLGHDWTPVNNLETVVEFMGAGQTTYVNEQRGVTAPNFHPGQAASRDDLTPEIGNEGDLGDSCVTYENVRDGVHGTCLLSAKGKGPNETGKHSIFVNSAIEAGINETIIKQGFAPDWIGLEAHFTKFMMDKTDEKKTGDPPTCLIIGVSGKPAGGSANVHKYPDSMTGATPIPGAQATQSAAKPTAGSAAPQVVNGSAAAAGIDGLDMKKITAGKLLDIAAKNPKPYTIKKLSGMVDIRFAQDNSLPQDAKSMNALQAKAHELLGNVNWLKEVAVDNDWVGPVGEGTGTTMDFTPSE